MSKPLLTIKAAGKDMNVHEWSLITGLKAGTIESRRKRAHQNYNDYSPEQVVGLEKLPDAVNQYTKVRRSPDHTMENRKMSRGREKDMFLLNLIFSRSRLI